MKDYADRWFEFIKEYDKQSSVPLSYVLLPNPQTTGFRAMGSPIGMTNLKKSEWRKMSEGGQRPKAAERRKDKNDM